MHNMTERDGFFTVRQAAWHGLGQVLEAHPTRGEAQKIAHDWEPVTEPVYRRVPKIVTLDDGSLDVQDGYEEVEQFKAVVRSDDGFTLSVQPDTYEVVRNSEMYDIAEAIEGGDPSQVRYETGGSLLGGRKVWLLLRLAEPLIIKGDPNGAVIPYYALQNNHDGGGAFRGQATMTRIVCDNTAKAADLDAQARGTEFVFRHTRNVADRIEEARTALAGWRVAVERYAERMALLIDMRIDVRQRDLFLEEFVPMPVANVISDRVRQNIVDARDTIGGILDGPTCEGVANTAYGLVQASIEYAEHYRRAHSRETRFKRAYLDRSVVAADAARLAARIAVGA